MPAFEMTFSFRNQTFTDAGKGLKVFSDLLKREWDGSAQALSRELKAFLTEVVEAIAGRNSGAWPGGTTDSSLSKRSGALVTAILDSVKVDGSTFDTIRGLIGAPGVPYASIQETGGVIKPKNAKYLCIPLPAALDSSGIPLKSSPRDWPGTFCTLSKAGNLIIFQKRGTSIVPLYVLKDSVTIPPRLGMRKSLDAGLPYFVGRAMDAIVKAMQK